MSAEKSDMGGVAINLKDANEVRSVVKDMERKFEAKELKFNEIIIYV
jgi:acyl-CoA synthetase (NDP forming)